MTRTKINFVSNKKSATAVGELAVGRCECAMAATENSPSAPSLWTP